MYTPKKSFCYNQILVPKRTYFGKVFYLLKNLQLIINIFMNINYLDLYEKKTKEEKGI